MSVTYEIVLSCAPTERLAAAFPELSSTAGSGGRMTLRGELRDQVELQSILNRAADLGLQIDAVNRIRPPSRPRGPV